MSTHIDDGEECRTLGRNYLVQSDHDKGKILNHTRLNWTMGQLMNPKLLAHLNSIVPILSAYYDSSKTMDSPTDIGNLREKFVKEFLRFHLPTIHEIQSGEIVDSSGKTSKQQDVVLYRRDMPKLAVSEGPVILFAEGVKATVEVKSNLTWDEFQKAFENICSVKALQPQINPFAVGEKTGYIFSYIFAYEAPNDDTLIEYYNRFRREKQWSSEDFFKNMPDALCVLKGSLFYKNDGWAFTKTAGKNGQVPLYVKSDFPHSFIKFFIHITLAVSYPDIFTINWSSYLNR
jgi:hypothetical protein